MKNCVIQISCNPLLTLSMSIFFSQNQLILFDHPTIWTFHTCRTCTSLGRKHQYLIRLFCSFFPGIWRGVWITFFDQIIFHQSSILPDKKLFKEKKFRSQWRNLLKIHILSPWLPKVDKKDFTWKLFFPSLCRKASPLFPTLVFL